MTKRLKKYIASFDYFDESLIVLSATSTDVSIASFAIVISAPVGIASASFNFSFFFNYRNCKKSIKSNTK